MLSHAIVCHFIATGEALMKENVSLDEIAEAQRHIAAALLGSSARSTLPAEKQDELLAQACAEACDILDRWVNGPAWDELRPAARGPIADVIPDWERVRPFLGPVGATLSRLSERRPGSPESPEIGDPEAYIDRLIKQAEATARRHPKLDRDELFQQATDRIKVLRSSVCGVATDFAKGAKTQARRRALARSALKAARSFLVSAALILAGVTPQALAHDVPQWGHEAVKVLFVHHAAQTAQPAVRIAPPDADPHLG
jgi:hypothetical protein